MTEPDPSSLLEQLHQLPFFASLERDVMKDMARQARWRSYEAGSVIFLEGESSRALYFLQSGWLKIVKHSTEGREQVLRHIAPGELFNQLAIFSNRPNPATAIALEPSVVCALPQEAIAQLVRQRPEVAQRVMEVMADRLIDLVELVADLSLRTVTGRLARLILQDAQDGVLSRPRWYTQAELAAYLGTVPDVLQRALNGLARDGMIEVARHEIRILDRARLESLTG